MGKKNKNKNKSNNSSISSPISITKGNLNLDFEEEGIDLDQHDDEPQTVSKEEEVKGGNVVELEEEHVASHGVEVPIENEEEQLNAVEDEFESVTLTSQEVSAIETEILPSPVIESILSLPSSFTSPIIEEPELEGRIDDDELISSPTTERINLEESIQEEHNAEEDDVGASTSSPTSTHNTSTTTLDESIGSPNSTAPPSSIKLFELPTSISLLPSTSTSTTTTEKKEEEFLPTSTNNSSITNLELISSSQDNVDSTPPSPTKSVKFSLPTTTTSILPSSTNATPPSSTLNINSNGIDGTTTYSPTTLEIPKQPTPRRGSTIRQLMVSLTRQRDLPPKSKDEEKRHLKELEQMLASSKATDLRRKSAFDLLTSQKATSLSIAVTTWESYILPNWRIVLRLDEEGKSLRNLWWKGTMPSKIRGRIWGMCIGNGLAVNRGSYAVLLGKAKELEEKGMYPEEVKRVMERDVEGTLKELKLFQKGGAMYDDLIDLLLAYSVYDKKIPEYPKGISFVAAMVLLNMSPPDAFLALINLVNKSILKSFYAGNLEDMEAYYRIFDTLLADNMPYVYANFTQETVKPSLYLFPWLTTLFVQYLPLDLSIRLFDNFLLEGDSFLFRVALVLLQILEPRLFNPQLSELEAVFKGIDRGAVVIVRREKTRGTGMPNGEVQEEVEVGIEEVYTEMGVTEETLFGKLELLDWKEETWDRLVTRELPEND